MRRPWTITSVLVTIAVLAAGAAWQQATPRRQPDAEITLYAPRATLPLIRSGTSQPFLVGNAENQVRPARAERRSR